MRALPQLLRKRPKARIVMLGGDGLSYASRPPDWKTWKQIFADKVRSEISDADWQRVHFLGRVPYEMFLSVLQSRCFPAQLKWVDKLAKLSIKPLPNTE